MVGYHKTAVGKLCSENGYSVVDDLTACIKAAGAFGHAFIQTEDLSNWPKGCHYVVSLNGVYFNQHDSGSANIDAAQICNGGKRMRSFLTSMNLLPLFQGNMIYLTNFALIYRCRNYGL